MRLILGTPDPVLSNAVREGAIAVITSKGAPSSNQLTAAMELAAARLGVLGKTEYELLIKWLGRLVDDSA